MLGRNGVTTSIGPVMPFNINHPMYDVGSTLTLWGEYRIGTTGPFMIPPGGGGITTHLSPEPGYMAVAGALLIGLWGARLRRKPN